MQQHGDLPSAVTRAPMVRVVLPFMLGLLLARSFSLPLIVSWSLPVVAFAIALWAWAGKLGYALRWLPGVAFILMFVALGALRQRLASVQSREDHLTSLSKTATGYELGIDELSSVKERSVRAWAEVESALVNGEAVPAQGRVLLTLMRDSTHAVPEKGDHLVVRGDVELIDRVPDPGGFDQRKWAAYHGAEHALFAPAGKWDLVKHDTRDAGFFEWARTRVAQWLRDSGLPPRERALAKAILLGMRDELDPEQNQAFVRSGTIHVLAVSGTHVGIIFIAVAWALSWFGKGAKERLLRGCIILIALWLYAGLTGFTPSVLRATVMFSLFTLAEMVRWRTESVNSLAAAAFLLLMWDPTMLSQLGFQLSFLAVLGIAVFYRSINLAWAPPNAVARFFWSLIAVSLAAQAFTIPLCLYTFHAFPVWFLPANMAIVGLVGLGVYGGIAVILFHAVPVLGPLLSVCLKWLLMLLGMGTGFFASLPASYPAVRIGWWGMTGMYLLIALFALWTLQGLKPARNAMFGMLAFLLCGWAWTAHERNAQHEFTVYDDRDGTMVSVVTGRTMRVFRTGQSERGDRKLEAHARIAGIREVIVLDSMPQWIRDGDATIGIAAVDRPVAAASAGMGPDMMVFHGNGRMARNFCDQQPHRQGTDCVLTGDLSSYARRKIHEWAEGNAMHVYDMRAEGAYVGPR